MSDEDDNLFDLCDSPEDEGPLTRLPGREVDDEPAASTLAQLPRGFGGGQQEVGPAAIAQFQIRRGGEGATDCTTLAKRRRVVAEGCAVGSSVQFAENNCRCGICLRNPHGAQ